MADHAHWLTTPRILFGAILNGAGGWWGSSTRPLAAAESAPPSCYAGARAQVWGIAYEFYLANRLTEP